MTLRDKLFALLGLIVGGLLLWYSFYLNSHGGVPLWLQGIYLIFFFPSFGLMAAEGTTGLMADLLIVLVVLMNGAIYAAASIALGRHRRK